MRQNQVFVFGSNEGGIHGAGAALVACKDFGMPYGSSFGHYGQSFGIPTKDPFIKTLPIAIIDIYVQAFKAYAYSRRKNQFLVTRIGCGLAGFTDEEMAPLFVGSPLNCVFDETWRPFLGDTYEYFAAGTVFTK